MRVMPRGVAKHQKDCQAWKLPCLLGAQDKAAVVAGKS